MFYPMRRGGQQLPQQQALQILQRGSAGVLALMGPNGYPYALPISYVYTDGAIYFHSATAGHKIQAIQHCPRASFCVIDRDQVVPQQYTTYYASAIAFGTVQIVQDNAQRLAALTALGQKYAPGQGQKALQAEIDATGRGAAVLKFTIQHLTAKAARELVEK